MDQPLPAAAAPPQPAMAAQVSAGVAPPAVPPSHTAQLANPTPAQAPPAQGHPPYAEMITTAITALKEKNGSSKVAIAKYIMRNYSNLPASHSSLLSHHLKRLKNCGQLVMVKHSYKLPRSALPNGTDDTATATTASPAGTKRRPGRPPKPKPEAQTSPNPNLNPAPISMFPATATYYPPAPPPEAIPSQPVLVPLEAYNGPVPVPNPVPAKRKPGRPRKGETGNGVMPSPGVKRKPGRPPKVVDGGTVHAQQRVGAKRAPGRPPKIGLMGGVVVGPVVAKRGRPRKDASAAGVKSSGRPRGRPPKRNVGSSVAGGLVQPPAATYAGMPPQVAAMHVAGGLVFPAAPVDGGVILPQNAAVNVADAGVPQAAAAKRRGRPPRVAGEPKKPRKLSGKPLGRPKKSGSATGLGTPNFRQAYDELKKKVEHYQARTKQIVSVIKPYLNTGTTVLALGALQELEELSNVDISAD